MKKLFALLLLTAAGCSTLMTNPLSGWRSVGDADWASNEGTIIATGGDGYIVMDVEHTSYDFIVEFDVDESINSGLFVHCQDEADISPVTCYEINIWDNHPNQNYRTGAIVTHVRPFTRIDTLGQWNRYRISVRPDRIDAYLNDFLVSSLEQPALAGGFIAIQRFLEGEARFRNIAVIPM